jgi:hypothetical protein
MVPEVNSETEQAKEPHNERTGAKFTALLVM